MHLNVCIFTRKHSVDATLVQKAISLHYFTVKIEDDIQKKREANIKGEKRKRGGESEGDRETDGEEERRSKQKEI